MIHFGMRTIILAVLCSTGCASVLPSRVVLTRDDMQQKIEEKFPIKKENVVATIALEHPRVSLDDRIGIAVDLRARLAILQIAGTAAITGRLEYEKESGTFFVTDCKLESIDAPLLRPEDLDAARQIIDPVLALTRIPIHELSGPKESLVRAYIKSVNVSGGQVIIELGL